MITNGMRATDLGSVTWVKSRRSNPSGNCVQLAVVDRGRVAMRDSKDPTGPALVFDFGSVADWVRDLKAGQYDTFLEDAAPMTGK